MEHRCIYYFNGRENGRDPIIRRKERGISIGFLKQSRDERWRQSRYARCNKNEERMDSFFVREPFFGSMCSISIRIEDIPRIIEPSKTAVRVHKGGEPVGTIRRKKPKDRDARKEWKRGGEREEGREERREETRRERTSRSLMGYPPRTSCNVIVGDHSMDQLSFVRISWILKRCSRSSTETRRMKEMDVEKNCTV